MIAASRPISSVAFPGCCSTWRTASPPASTSSPPPPESLTVSAMSLIDVDREVERGPVERDDGEADRSRRGEIEPLPWNGSLTVDDVVESLDLA